MNLTVSASIKDVFTQDFTVTGNNKLILQRAEIPSNFLPSTLAINASGKGCALLQVRTSNQWKYVYELSAVLPGGIEQNYSLSFQCFGGKRASV